MRIVIVAALIALAACSPANERAEPSENTQLANEVAVALRNVLEADLGRPVSLRIDTQRQDGDWAWIAALPQTPDGAAVDWSTTRYAEQAREGMLDGGVTYALLQRQNGEWVVRDYAVGPTDVAYMTWPQDYGAPAALMGLENAP